MLMLTMFLLEAVTAETTDHKDMQQYKVLQFGRTENDYVMFTHDMSQFETGFTICSWVRKMNSDWWPTWFNYAVSNEKHEIMITDMGRGIRLFGVQSFLESLYTVTPGLWFHNCLSWDSASSIKDVYIDGAKVSSVTEAGRTLRQGGTIMLGNEQEYGPGAGMDKYNIFGGQLFKLNMFTRKLTDSEIQEMSKDMCSEVEIKYGDERGLKWEDLLQKTRHGNITEDEIEYRQCKTLNYVWSKLQETNREYSVSVEEIKDITGLLFAQLNSSNLRQESAIAKLKGNIEELESDITQLNSSNMAQESAIAKWNSSDMEQESAIAKLNSRNKEQENAMTKLNNSNKEQESAIAKLNSRNKEQENAIAKLNNSNKEQESTIAKLKGWNEEQKIAFAKLNGSAIEQKIAIAKLNNRDKERESAIAKLNSRDMEHESAIAKLNSSAVKQESAMAELNNRDMKQESAIAKLNGSTIEQESAIATLNSSAIEQESAIAKLNSSAIEQESVMAELKNRDMKHESAIAKLNGSTMEQESAIATLNSSAIEQESAIATLNSSAIEQEYSIDELNSSNSELEDAIRKLNKSNIEQKNALTEQRNAINGLSNSTQMRDNKAQSEIQDLKNRK